MEGAGRPRQAPIITPRQFLGLQDVTPDDNPCARAIVAFCPFRGLTGKVGAQRLDKPVLTHLDAAHQLQATIEGREVLMADRVYGGPVCATVIEEMAYLGVTHVVAYGYCGSLRAEIRPGTIVRAASALTTDGTSRDYTDREEVQPGPAMGAVYGRLSHSAQRRVLPVRVWTTDAIYREYPTRVASWRARGADVVNMDTSPLYAVSRAVSIESIYLAVVSDYVGSDEWTEDFAQIGEAIDTLHDLVIALVGAI